MGRGGGSREVPGARRRESATDPRRHFYAGNLSPAARGVIESEADRNHAILAGADPDNGPTNCDWAAPLWFHSFQEAGLDAMIISGHYDPQHEPEWEPYESDDCLVDVASFPEGSIHNWVLVEGEIFDRPPRNGERRSTLRPTGRKREEEYDRIDDYMSIEELEQQLGVSFA